MNSLAPAAPPPAYDVRAFNTAAASENKIHDDSVAQKFGFTGALVPGVEVYAYMAHMPVARWGRDWLDGGVAEARFLKPVYDGNIARVTAQDQDGALALSVDSGGAHCATGLAGMPATKSVAPAPNALPLAVPPKERPKASDSSLAPGLALGISPLTVDRALLETYLADIRETDDIYLRENLVHPGQILRLCNAALVQNVVLGPWIHVGSKVQNFSAARVGDELTVRSRITSNVLTKGHAIVEFDALIVANDRTTIAHVVHTSIWRPRHVAEAG